MTSISFCFFKSFDCPKNSMHFSISKISFTVTKLSSISKDNSCKLRQSWIVVVDKSIQESGCCFNFSKILIKLLFLLFISIPYWFNISLLFLILLISLLFIRIFKISFISFENFVFCICNFSIKLMIAFATLKIYSFCDINNRFSYNSSKLYCPSISKISLKVFISFISSFSFPFKALTDTSKVCWFILYIPSFSKRFLNS